MPERYMVRIVCSNCGFVLHEYSPQARDKYFGPPVLTKVLESYNYVCPRCGRRLSQKPVEVDIKVFDDEGKEKH